MSGASGKVLAAIHVVPEAACGGPIAKLRAGDVIRIDAHAGTIDVVAPSDWSARPAALPSLAAHHMGLGRELFGGMRALVGNAEQGACSLYAEA